MDKEKMLLILMQKLGMYEGAFTEEQKLCIAEAIIAAIDQSRK